MPRVRNTRASEADRIGKGIKRNDIRTPLVKGSLHRGTLRVGAGARLVVDGQNNIEMPIASPSNSGLMSASYAALLDSASSSGSNNLMMRDSQGRSEVSDPSDPQDIANKRYVDDAVDSAGGGVEVDTSVGTRVSTSDGVVIHYDSGWRDASSYLNSDNVITDFSQYYLRRTLDTLFVDIPAISFTEPGVSTGTGIAGALPVGWRPRSPVRLVGWANNTTEVRVQMSGSGVLSFISQDTSSPTQKPNFIQQISVAVPVSGQLPTSLVGDPA